MDLAALFRRQMPRWEQTKDAAWLEQVKDRLAVLEKSGKAEKAPVVANVTASDTPAPVKLAAKKATKKTAKKGK